MISYLNAPLEYDAHKIHICARFKQKRSLGCISDFEIQAYLGSGVKFCFLLLFFSPSLAFYLSSEKKLEHGRHFFNSFFGIFIVHFCYQGMCLETLNGLISKVVFWTT